MIVIGLTGGIASGKSAAGAFLSELGAKVWDGDKASRELSRPDSPFCQAIREYFGPLYFDAQGNLMRDKLAKRVFSDERERNLLNSLAHPLLLEDLRLTLEDWRAQGAAVAVIEAALLFEAGADRYCDEVWTLSCGMDEQLLRMIERDKMDLEQAQARLDAQMTDAQRRARATRVIDTSGDVMDTRRHLQSLYDELLESHAQA